MSTLGISVSTFDFGYQSSNFKHEIMMKPKAVLEVLSLSFVRLAITMSILPYGSTIPYSHPLVKILFAILVQHVPKCIPFKNKKS